MSGRIEDELRLLGAWRDESPDQATIDARGPFGMYTMAFTQWLQFVLIPRLRDVADGTAEPPSSSEVGPRAVREFDGWHEADDLASVSARSRCPG